jgi:hypothetical protein
MGDYREVSDEDLEKGYWWLTHKQMVVKMTWVISIIALVILYISLFFGVYRYTGSLTLEQWSNELNQTFDWSAYHQARSPQSVQVSGGEFFAVNSRLYNLVAAIQNPNDDWSITELDYRFVVDGKPAAIQKSFLNPGENKLLLQLGYEVQSPIRSLEVEIIDVNWQRFDQGVPIINWDIDAAVYVPAIVDNSEEGVNLPARVNWQAKNLSLYNLWAVDWQIALYNRDRLVGVNKIRTEDWSATETRNLEAIWLYDLPYITRVEIFPVVNWLDQENFKAGDKIESGKDRVNL